MISLRLKVEEKDLTGKIAIVTGANTGIGLETARMLAQMHAHVILACRNEEKGALAAADIVETTGNKGVESWPLDLSSFASIHAFAERFGKEHEKLDLLINNAGLVMMEKAITGDGIEMTLQVNHLSPLLLTNLLLPQLRRAASPRVINVSSVGHFDGVINFGNLQYAKPGSYRALKAYSDTKLMNILFTEELARKEPGIITHALHPGFVKSDIWFREDRPWYLKLVFRVATLAARDCVQGAMTTVHCAVSDKAGASNAKYWDSCRQVEPKAVAHDRDVAKRLWEISEELAGLTNAPEGGERA
ncbi:hypothetical protein BC938DRAFT_472513 [Jimgerdemannia flammicorona]|uniref:Uncharacterized protein n=1 Tax=Jimgerdemannia flammicorona TaxID=994334 RepID=A0A433QTW1_9FUNG|nr:hypothetical protein BC938DRAFT_472513 [Jimgerdemannia flammicorona]